MAAAATIHHHAGVDEAFPSLPSSDTITPLAGPNRSDKPALRPVRRRTLTLGDDIIRAGDYVGGLATMAPPPISPAINKKQRRPKTPFQQYKRYALKHTWVTPLILIGICLVLFAVNPRESNPLWHFIFLSYAVPRGLDEAPDAPIRYGKGRWDIAFMLFYTLVLSFTREFMMQQFLRPLAKIAGMKSRAKQSRFMEQTYTAIYFAILGPYGLYVMSRTPVWYFNVTGMFEGFPHKTLQAEFKFYYLFQASYWAQQAIVLCLGLEKPRKDFKELVAHHIVTLCLVLGSYGFHFTYMGIGVFITHDLSDFFFATAKTLNYIDHPWTGPYFGFFICMWIYLRHYLNLIILRSEFYEFKTVGPYGPLDWENEQYKGPVLHFLSTAFLGALQCLNLFWLFLILRVAYRFIFLDRLEDDRSDNEGDEEDEEPLVRAVDVPKVALNGMLTNGKSSALQPQANGAINRKAL